MPLLFARLIVVGLAYYVGKELFRNDEEFKIRSGSNCHDRFRQFDKAITISPHIDKKLKRAHQAIRPKLTAYFRDYPDLPSPGFFIQGSYKMKTLIDPIQGSYDIDLGVFFGKKPSVKIETIQSHIKLSIEGHTSQRIVTKANCVRLPYSEGFHIDLPIYYTDGLSGETYFGSKGCEWIHSDPKQFISWFKEQTKNKPQLVRLIRYMKAWADLKRNRTNRKLPSGLVFTLWVIEFYESAKRDDVAFFQTCTGILDYLHHNRQRKWDAQMPVAPFDNTLDRLTDSQKSNFYELFEKLVSYSADALNSKSESEAFQNWKKIFGDRFK